MYFSDAFDIKNPLEEDWFNLSLNRDSPLFIDPMLVFQTDKEEFINSGKRIKDFFKNVFERVALLKGTEKIKTDQILQKMLEFEEPKELCLGITKYGSDGRGIGQNFSIQIREGIVNLLDLGLEEFGEYVSPIEMFVDGIGWDRIGDIMGNLLKEDLIKYTQKICKENNIPTKKVAIKNIKFDKTLGWIHDKKELPINPLNKKPIILVPKDFLSTNFHLDREDFLEYALHIENNELRKQASRLFTLDINKRKLLEIMHQNQQIMKEILRSYIKKKENEKAYSYDYINDPEGLNEIPRLIEKITEKLEKIKIESFNFEDLKKFVEKVINEFQFQIENHKGNIILFDKKGNPLKEKISQIFFWNIASTLCRNTGKLVDINPESETGRGPVDFKFSRGYDKRILVELKLAKDKNRLLDGLEKQTLAYINSDEIDLAYYVVIKQIIGDDARVAELKDRYSKINFPKGKNIQIKVIDATLKPSASKL